MTFKTNTIVVYDLLGEGEITLVDGLASIYLDKTPIANASTAAKIQSQSFDGTISGGSLTFTSDSVYAPGTYRSVLVVGGSKSSTIAATPTPVAGSDILNVTTPGFFTSTMIASNTEAVDGLYQKVRIRNGDIQGTAYEAEIIDVISGTQAKLDRPIQQPVAGTAVTFDHFTRGVVNPTAIANEYKIVLDVVPPIIPIISDQIIIGGEPTDSGYRYSNVLNFKTVGVSYRAGTINQLPVINFPGFTNASAGKAFGTEIKQHSDYYNQKLVHGEDTIEKFGVAGGTVEILSGTDLPVEADRVLLTISVQGLKGYKASVDETVPAGVTFQIWFDYKNRLSDNYSSELIFGPTDNEILAARTFVWRGQVSPFYSTGDISGLEDSSSDYEFAFNIDQYKPFSFYKIRIKRITATNYKHGKWVYTNSTVLKSAQAFIDDKLTYPFSAYCALMLDSNEHQGSLPQRAYHVRGLRCQVPSNYVTREEASDGIAKYTRNVVNGTIESTYQNWDGQFRDNIYCNNPVWILRTLLLNKRFGLGNWLLSDNINNFSFYSLARRCDELVSDGEGGLEPRFVCGVYLTEAEEAYSIIKNFCSIMFSLPFWIDGKLLLEADRPKEPIYTFTKGNIIDGLFAYENTGTKARPNQIAVTFNDSKNFYDATVELVDDIESMIETGRVISEEAVAFGAVTRSQAIRYAKWKLLTSKYNTEIISFRTGENAGMLKPGDIVRVQDADRKRIRHSGRIQGASSQTVITLDKSVTLVAGNTYKLHCMVEGDAIYVAQTEATIQGPTIPITYKYGDILPTNLPQFSGTTNGLANAYNEETSVRLVDTSGNPVKTVWAPNMHIETRNVTTAASTTNILTVDSNFSVIPKNDFIWALSLQQNNVNIDNGGNLYRILGIAEESIGTYSVTASLHFNEKFEELDELYLSTTPGQLNYQEEIPSITNFSASPSYVTSSVNESASTRISTDIQLRWTPPQTSGPSGTFITYPNLANYKIEYVDPSGNLIIVEAPPTSNNYLIQNVQFGTYEFTIRALGLAKNISNPAFTSVQIKPQDNIPATVRQSGGLHRGGHFSVSPAIEGKLLKTLNSYTFTSPSGITVEIINGDLV